jgi:TatD DNase family protein
LALKRRGLRVRVNTDGQANLVHGRNILPELSGLVDALSVSLNAADPQTYQTLCRTPFGAEGFQGVCDFLREAKRHIPQVTASVVALPGLDVASVRELALTLGVEFREREYAELG